MIDITLYEVVQSHIQKFSNNINTSIPAKVTRVNTEGDAITSVSARPVINKLYKDSNLSFQVPDLDYIPVVFPSAGGGILSFPIKEGDTVLLIFSHGDIENFIYGGVDSGSPNTLRKFSQNDAIAIPCVYPTTDNLEPHKDNVELKFKDSVISITPDGTVKVLSADNVVVECPDGDIDIVSGKRISIDGQNVNIDCTSLAINSQTAELITVLEQLMEQVSLITVTGSPIDNKAAVEVLKPLLASFK